MTEAILMTGEKPGVGTYRCIHCGSSLVLNYYLDLLPNCHTCFGVEFYTIEIGDLQSIIHKKKTL
ncbi:MAG: hypothetical protein ACW990_18400 [Promethearchaeota archaeon]|jgi:uncharacterized protein (DUF983 family)